MIDEKKLLEDLKNYFKNKIDKIPDEEENSKDVWKVLEANKAICNIVKSQPKVFEWIPVERELPPMPYYSYEEPYIVTCDDVLKPFCAYWDGGGWTDGNDFSVYNVTAWMPLPERYREDFSKYMNAPLKAE